MVFIACEGNARPVVMDLQSMTVTESHDVGTVPDVLAFDEPRRILFVAAESGPLTALFKTDTGLKLLARRDVGPNAHAVAVDPDTGHVYVRPEHARRPGHRNHRCTGLSGRSRSARDRYR